MKFPWGNHKTLQFNQSVYPAKELRGDEQRKPYGRIRLCGCVVPLTLTVRQEKPSCHFFSPSGYTSQWHQQEIMFWREIVHHFKWYSAISCHCNIENFSLRRKTPNYVFWPIYCMYTNTYTYGNRYPLTSIVRTFQWVAPQKKESLKVYSQWPLTLPKTQRHTFGKTRSQLNNPRAPRSHGVSYWQTMTEPVKKSNKTRKNE